ncbi:MAG TPA: hypothetical protein VK281_16890 [Xanthobacteraceae bacterium]|nr:hypothetical protein [Xanthobacteraceae bacterium]
MGLLAGLVPAWAGRATAAQQRLECVLTDADAQRGGGRRPITIAFDEDTKTITLDENGQARPLRNVAISNTSMSSHADDVSVGVDRSSLRVVFQTYGQGSVANEYGQCKPAATR